QRTAANGRRNEIGRALHPFGPVWETSIMTQPESFSLDHRIVAAPYMRVGEVRPLVSGGVVTKFDLRFRQPNVAHLEMPTLHSIEHLLAGFLRDHSDNVIDISPMGCQTGFYIAIDGEFTTEQMAELPSAALGDLLEADHVPASNEGQCGGAAAHSLTGAQAAGRDFLAGRDTWHEVFAQ